MADTPQARELSQSAGCTKTKWEEDQFPSLRHRYSNHGRRRARMTSGPTKRRTNDFSARSDPNEPIDPYVIYGPYTQYQIRLEALVYVLTAAHYVVSCSVGPDSRNLRPFFEVLDTGS